MKKEIIDVPGISKHLRKEGIPLSAVVRAGGFVFVSGQPPVDRRTGKIPLVGITKQTQMVLDNIKVCLEAAGSSLDRVVKTTVFLMDLADFGEMNEVYARHVGDRPPARSTVQISGLPSGALVEIEAIAHI